MGGDYAAGLGRLEFAGVPFEAIEFRAQEQERVAHGSLVLAAGSFGDAAGAVGNGIGGDPLCRLADDGGFGGNQIALAGAERALEFIHAFRSQLEEEIDDIANEGGIAFAHFVANARIDRFRNSGGGGASGARLFVGTEIGVEKAE